MPNPLPHCPVRPRHPALWTACATALIAALTVVPLGGCAFFGSEDPIVESASPPVAQGRTLDVQVLRSGASLSLTNTSGVSFGASRVWANRWYSTELASLATGETITLDLNDFRDRYGRAFRAGGFFATETSDRLVQMQIEHEGTLYGLVVIDGRR